jgi:hypothetical protein
MKVCRFQRQILVAACCVLATLSVAALALSRLCACSSTSWRSFAFSAASFAAHAPGRLCALLSPVHSYQKKLGLFVLVCVGIFNGMCARSKRLPSWL